MCVLTGYRKVCLFCLHVVCTACVCVFVSSCPTTKVLISKISGHQKGGGVSRWREWIGKATAYKFVTRTLIGVHLTMHLMDPINF